MMSHKEMFCCQMFQRFQFPVEVQRWIVGKRVAKDDDTLARCGVRHDNNLVYLYLLSAKSVGLSHDVVTSRDPLTSSNPLMSSDPVTLQGEVKLTGYEALCVSILYVCIYVHM